MLRLHTSSGAYRGPGPKGTGSIGSAGQNLGRVYPAFRVYSETLRPIPKALAARVPRGSGSRGGRKICFAPTAIRMVSLQTTWF